jgi:tRNA modification GTPase
MPLHIADTAGLREEADVIESEGIRRAHAEMSRADRILYVVDATRALDDASIRNETAVLPRDIPVTWVFNKVDAVDASARLQQTSPPRVYLSAQTGAGIDLLREHLKECVGYQGADAGVILARRRHLDALNRAREHLDEALRHLHERRAGELMAEELRLAQQSLGEITGEFSSDDLLGRIFSSFCIGK